MAGYEREIDNNRRLGRPQTYVERELDDLGFSFVRQDRGKVVLQKDDREVEFNCVCPYHPKIIAMGCPLHHEGPGGSWPVEKSKSLILSDQSLYKVL